MTRQRTPLWPQPRERVSSRDGVSTGFLVVWDVLSTHHWPQ